MRVAYGALAALTLSFPSGGKTIDLAAGDFDGDGATDLVVANPQGTTVSVLRGNGDGTFGPPLSRASTPCGRR